MAGLGRIERQPTWAGTPCSLLPAPDGSFWMRTAREPALHVIGPDLRRRTDSPHHGLIVGVGRTLAVCSHARGEELIAASQGTYSDMLVIVASGAEGHDRPIGAGADGDG